MERLEHQVVEMKAHIKSLEQDKRLYEQTNQRLREQVKDLTEQNAWAQKMGNSNQTVKPKAEAQLNQQVKPEAQVSVLINYYGVYRQ